MQVCFPSLRGVLVPLVAIGASCLGLTAGGCGPSSTPTSTACGAYFDALYGSHCDPNRAASEAARDRGRFVTLCDADLALTGIATSASQLESCANALTAAGICLLEGTSSLPTQCQGLNSGTLGSGADCFSGSQCQSGNCLLTADGGAVATCGSCTAPIAVGQPCTASGGNCGMGSVCSDTTMTCQVVVHGNVGAACGSNVALCSDGLYCDPTTLVCASAKSAGSSCTMIQGECASPLVCLSTTNACGNPGAAGAACMISPDCAPGFDCGTSNQCAAVTYAAAGEPCGGSLHCLVGSCTGIGTSLVCPTVVADGLGCSLASGSASSGATPTTCDTFASCDNGVCTLAPPTCH